MSLIVARKEKETICIVSDTKLTYPDDLFPKLEIAPPDKGVIKTTILNHQLCVSFACNDIAVAEIAIKECRRISNNISAILNYLLKLNIQFNNEIEFIVCLALPGVSKIYEIKNSKYSEVEHSWIGSIDGYNIFQEAIHKQKSTHKRSEISISDMSSAMDQVIRSGKDITVSGFTIKVSNESGVFCYNNHITFSIVPQTVTGNHIITHGTAQEGGYSLNVFSDFMRPDILAIHVRQGEFGIIYKPLENGLLRPEIVSNVDEVEFIEITERKYKISPPGITFSRQESYFNRGNKAYNKQDYTKALSFYNQGLKENEPRLKANLLYNKGIVLLITKRFQEAKLCLLDAVRLDKSFEERVKKILFQR